MNRASGGATNNSATNIPVFQVQRLDNDQTRFIANDETVNLSDAGFTGSASAFAGFPAGPVRVRVWVNGVPSAAQYSTLAVTTGVPAGVVSWFAFDHRDLQRRCEQHGFEVEHRRAANKSGDECNELSQRFQSEYVRTKRHLHRNGDGSVAYRHGDVQRWRNADLFCGDIE